MKLKLEVSKCWEQYGVDHPKCAHLLPKLDRGWAIDLVTKQKYEEQVSQFPAHFDALIAPKPDKMYFKGVEPTGPYMMNRPFKIPKY
ncbi:UNKNOWN [Stylonychia lemnae]|uniref:Uncharacterized protein n=1 Tax=Stylonychia lemnae TaxID=5949 RepID=A0A078B9Y3_STYLE|nr:UNKNOWN [Stylonychia lemnae]|eukprot:CDW91229.1 UNKNOWN [Stylonychia lemnae]